MRKLLVALAAIALIVGIVGAVPASAVTPPGCGSNQIGVYLYEDAGPSDVFAAWCLGPGGSGSGDTNMGDSSGYVTHHNDVLTGFKVYIGHNTSCLPGMLVLYKDTGYDGTAKHWHYTAEDYIHVIPNLGSYSFNDVTSSVRFYCSA